MSSIVSPKAIIQKRGEINSISILGSPNASIQRNVDISLSLNNSKNASDEAIARDPAIIRALPKETNLTKGGVTGKIYI